MVLLVYRIGKASSLIDLHVDRIERYRVLLGVSLSLKCW